MPGIIMENGSRNGSHTNHDRDQHLNNTNGANGTCEKTQDKGKGLAELQQNGSAISTAKPTALNGTIPDVTHHEGSGTSQGSKSRVNELPPEIVHITQGYVALTTLITRLAQKTDNRLVETLADLKAMPLPASASNGAASHAANVDDNSVENVNKKLRLLKFAESAHADWAKVLVINEWSRRANDVSRMIDLKVHLDQQKTLYNFALDRMANVKRDLAPARLPNPDFKTAVQVMTTGKAPWMPELNYIPTRPYTAREMLDSLERMNMLLSIRMNLYEYDKIPRQFRNFTINSGRITFRVPGEFELDLTIADEDPESQFWFIDFRFLFSPTLAVLAPQLHSLLEYRLNATLYASGLEGSYRLLHQLVLTHKISEFRRQAVGLARGTWEGSLDLELLNRSICIQYWLGRHGRRGPKSWIIIGVHSGRRKKGIPDPNATSRLSLRWFRESKEVKDAEILFDQISIQAEHLIKRVIAKHINHILTTAYQQLRERPLYAKREMSLELLSSADEPWLSHMKIEIRSREYLTVRIDPLNGRVQLDPKTPIVTRWERRLNRSKDLAAELSSCIENLRCNSILDDIFRHALSLGWSTTNPGLRSDELQPVLPRDTVHTTWFRRRGWSRDWFVAVTLSMSGERWWLLEKDTNDKATPKHLQYTRTRVISSFQIPIKSISPNPTYTFMSTLHLFGAALICHYANLRTLHSRRALYILHNNNPSSVLKIPAIFIRLSEILPSFNKGKQRAKDIIRLTFQGFEVGHQGRLSARQSLPSNAQTQSSNTVESSSQGSNVISAQGNDALRNYTPPDTATLVTEARMVVPVPAALSILKERVDKDIAFHAKSGAFAFRLLTVVGESVIPALIERITRVGKLVEFVEVLHKHKKTLKCELVSLRSIIFRYATPAPATENIDMDIDAVAGDSNTSHKAVVDFSGETNTMSLDLEQGNPHLRILDYLSKLLNHNNGNGLDGVATLLPLTLPTLRAFDAIEEAWTPLSSHGEVFIFTRAVEWYILRYNLYPPSSTSKQSDAPPRARKIIFHVKLLQRHSEPWWTIRRIDPRDLQGDEIDAGLKDVWTGKGEAWQGMRVSAVARPSGVEELLARVDEVLRTVEVKELAVNAGQGTGGAPSAAAMRNPQNSQSQAQTQTQIQRNSTAMAALQRQALGQKSNQGQMQRQASNQGQNQARGTQGRREIVEID